MREQEDSMTAKHEAALRALDAAYERAQEVRRNQWAYTYAEEMLVLHWPTIRDALTAPGEAPRSLADWQAEVYAWAGRKGWLDKPVSIPEQVALIHSEVSEALEAFRIGQVETVDIDGKPEGYYSELADAVIRILHYCALGGASLADELARKMSYNEKRPYRHGGKAI